jgi:hypothetical protein
MRRTTPRTDALTRRKGGHVRVAVLMLAGLGVILQAGSARAGDQPLYLSSTKEIAAAKSDVDDIDIRDLPLENYPLLAKFSRVKYIRLYGIEGQLGTDDMMKALAARSFTNLTYINLVNNHHVTDEGIRALSTIPTLRMLVLDGTSITDRGCSVLASEMRLTSLRVSDCAGVTPKGLKVLATSDSLKHLSFSAGCLTADDALALIDAMRGINWCEITDPLRKLDETQVASLRAKAQQGGSRSS